MQYQLGLLLGLTSGVLVGFLVMALLFKRKVLDLHFDERQERARGKAFQYGFLTLMGCLFLYGASEMTLGRWCEAMAGVTLCIAISLVVFAVICICKDAYLSLRENPRQVMTMFTLLSLINLGFGGVSLASGKLIMNGVLTFRAMNPIIGCATLTILAVYIVNIFLQSREEAE